MELMIFQHMNGVRAALRERSLDAGACKSAGVENNCTYLSKMRLSFAYCSQYPAPAEWCAALRCFAYGLCPLRPSLRASR